MDAYGRIVRSGRQRDAAHAMAAGTAPSHWRTRPAHAKGDVMRKSQTAFKGAVVVALLLALAAPAVAQETGSAPEALEPAREVPIEGTVVGQHWINPSAPGCDEGTSWRFYSSGTGQISDIGEVDYFLTQCTLFDPEGLSATSGDGITTFTSADGDIRSYGRQSQAGKFITGKSAAKNAKAPTMDAAREASRAM